MRETPIFQIRISVFVAIPPLRNSSADTADVLSKQAKNKLGQQTLRSFIIVSMQSHKTTFDDYRILIIVAVDCVIQIPLFCVSARTKKYEGSMHTFFVKKNMSAISQTATSS